MQDFLKEWGPAIITAIVVVLLVAIVKAVAPIVSKGMINNVDRFSDRADQAATDADSWVTTKAS